MITTDEGKHENGGSDTLMLYYNSVFALVSGSVNHSIPVYTLIAEIILHYSNHSPRSIIQL